MATIQDKIRQRVLKFLKLEHLSDSPNDDRYTFINDDRKLQEAKIKEFKVWYYGDSNELLNFYLAQQTYKNNNDPIYNRNKREYFWGISSEENHIKRIHSGIPKAIVDTLVNIVGTPLITSETEQEKIDTIIEKTKLKNLVNQKQLPMTLALGWGAFKPIVDKEVCADSPLVEWYNADDVEFVVKHGVIIGVIFKDYYDYKGKKYVLIETRRIKGGDSYIEYNLYKLSKSDDVIEVELGEIPELGELPVDGLVIRGYNKVLAVPSVFFYDMNNENYGKSIFTGKIDLFDDLDQDLSQASQTSRVSTPVEYIPIDLTERTRDGKPILPKVYNRQYIASNSYPNGDGELEGKITTTQPQLNFQQYTDKCFADLNFILTGILSPATLGINIGRDDNALAQREKEKVSIMSRNNIIDREEVVWKDLLCMLLDLQEYMTTGNMTIQDHDISVKFEEFACPTFENTATLLSGMLTSNAISPELYVDKLYGDSLSDEEKQREVEYIKERQQADTLDTQDFDSLGLGGMDDGATVGTTTTDTEPEQETTATIQE